MDFGSKIANIIFILAENATSSFNITRRLTNAINIAIPTGQGCPLSPFLLAIARHPLLCFLGKKAMKGSLTGVLVHKRDVMGWD